MPWIPLRITSPSITLKEAAKLTGWHEEDLLRWGKTGLFMKSDNGLYKLDEVINWSKYVDPTGNYIPPENRGCEIVMFGSNPVTVYSWTCENG